MRRSDIGNESPGELVMLRTPRGEEGYAFLPDELPPSLSVTAAVAKKAERAGIALGNLNGLGRLIPNPWILINPFVRKEALASSRIEGTRADFDQLAIFEATASDEDENPDIQEVMNYVRALGTAWNADPGWVISSTSIAEMHRILMLGVRGENATPGQFRDVPVFIGNPIDTFRTARFVPPPPYEVRRLLDNLNAYIAGEDEMPVLVKLAVAHYQFETIHPFRDGNGRLGRMLIPLHLRHWGILDFPLLYISEYFERRRDTYLDLLYLVSRDGDWEGWVSFFLDAIMHQSQVAVYQARLLLDVRDSLRSRYQGDRSPYILAAIDGLFAHPSLSTQKLQEEMGISKSTANQLVRRLHDDGILAEITGKQRYKVYVARPIIDVITAEVESSE